jgi:hypothetical protein
LGCELTEAGDLKTTNMFDETILHVVLAAVDCATPLKAALNTMDLGSMAAAGLAGQLEAEIME